MGIFDFLFGSEDKHTQKSTLNPGQQRFQNDIFFQLKNMMGQGGGYNNAMGWMQDFMNPDSETYQNFAQPYMRQFNEQTVPGLAERFAGMGAQGGGLSSSGFGQSLSSAGAGLQENLASMRSNLLQNTIRDYLNQFNQMSNLGLNRGSVENFYQPGNQGLLGNVAGAFAGGAGKSFGNMAGKGMFGG